MNTFIGVDLGWYGKPSGLASIALEGSALHLRNIARLESVDEILDWIQTEAGEGSAVAAVDAPLVIRNQTSIRPAERELNADFRRFHAGCHAANLGRSGTHSCDLQELASCNLRHVLPPMGL